MNQYKGAEPRVVKPTRCERCNGIVGTECLGGSDCDINVDLARDGVDPAAWRNTDPGR
jgi:hypothetical protein